MELFARICRKYLQAIALAPPVENLINNLSHQSIKQQYLNVIQALSLHSDLTFSDIELSEVLIYPDQRNDLFSSLSPDEHDPQLEKSFEILSLAGQTKFQFIYNESHHKEQNVIFLALQYIIKNIIGLNGSRYPNFGIAKFQDIIAKQLNNRSIISELFEIGELIQDLSKLHSMLEYVDSYHNSSAISSVVLSSDTHNQPNKSHIEKSRTKRQIDIPNVHNQALDIDWLPTTNPALTISPLLTYDLDNAQRSRILLSDLLNLQSTNVTYEINDISTFQTKNDTTSWVVDLKNFPLPNSTIVTYNTCDIFQLFNVVLMPNNGVFDPSRLNDLYAFSLYNCCVFCPDKILPLFNNVLPFNVDKIKPCIVVGKWIWYRNYQLTRKQSKDSTFLNDAYTTQLFWFLFTWTAQCLNALESNLSVDFAFPLTQTINLVTKLLALDDDVQSNVVLFKGPLFIPPGNPNLTSNVQWNPKVLSRSVSRSPHFLASILFSNVRDVAHTQDEMTQDVMRRSYVAYLLPTIFSSFIKFYSPRPEGLIYKPNNPMLAKVGYFPNLVSNANVSTLLPYVSRETLLVIYYFTLGAYVA